MVLIREEVGGGI